jgi:hypothetical protein
MNEERSGAQNRFSRLEDDFMSTLSSDWCCQLLPSVSIQEQGGIRDRQLI